LVTADHQELLEGQQAGQEQLLLERLVRGWGRWWWRSAALRDFWERWRHRQYLTGERLPTVHGPAIGSIGEDRFVGRVGGFVLFSHRCSFLQLARNCKLTRKKTPTNAVG
jgi:hypothetical protein